MSDSQFDELFAKYISASERNDQAEMNRLLASNQCFAARIKSISQIDLSLKQMIGTKIKESEDQEPSDSSVDEWPTVDSTLTFPRTFGCFELVDVVGEGGMGIVYRAKQLRLGNRVVALKVSRLVEEAWAGKNLNRTRFQTEIDVAAKLDHPNIVPVYESGKSEGRHYIAMKLVEGTSLNALDASSQSAEVQRLILIAEAVQHAHDRGVLHRDLKPSNIIVDSRGIPFVTDFGLAKLLEQSQSITRTGASIGTPQYMSPEQAEGSSALTVTSDVYSLGTILFERVCGQPLYDLATPTEIVNKVRFGARPNLRLLNTKCDRDLRAIILKCLEWQPTDRYESCRMLVRDLDRWINGEPLDTRTVRFWQRGVRWVVQHPGKMLLAAALLIGFVSVVGLYVANDQNHWKYRITEYARHLQVARAELSERQPGWRDRAYRSLESAAQLSLASESKEEIASLRANCEIGFDIGKPLYSIEQTNTITIKFHPTKPLLFLARKYAEDNEFPCPILVVDTTSGKIIDRLMVFDIDRMKRCSIRDIAIVPASDALAVLTGSPSLQVISIAPTSFGELLSSQNFELASPILQEIDGEEILVLAGVNKKGVWQLSSLNTTTWSIIGTRELPDGMISMTQDSDKHRLITCEPNGLQTREPRLFERVWAPIPIDYSGNISYFFDQVAVVSQNGIDLYGIPHPVKTHHLWSNPSRHTSLDSIRNMLCYSHVGNILATSDNERHQVALWDSADRTFLQSIYLKDSMYQTIAMDTSKDGLLAVFTGNETVVYSVKQPSTNRIANSPSSIDRICFAPKRKELFTLTHHSVQSFRADLQRFSIGGDALNDLNKTVIVQIPYERMLRFVVSPDERFLAVTSNLMNTRIRVLDFRTLETLGYTSDLNGVRNATFDSTGRLFATIRGGLASFSQDLSQIEHQWIRPQIKGSVLGSANYPLLERLDDAHFFVGDEDGWLSKLHWTESPKATAIMRLSDAPLWSSALSERDRVLAVGDGNGCVTMIDVDSCKLLAQKSETHLSRVTNMAWTASGYLVSIGLDRALRFWKWNVNNQSLEKRLEIKLQSNGRQIFPIRSEARKEEIILLREGASAVERLTVSMPE